MEDGEPAGLESPSLAERLKSLESETYPWPALADLPIKYSVSALKKMAMEENSEKGERLFYQEPEKLPAFLREARDIGPAARGTLYHRVMECLTFDGETGENFVISQLESMIGCGKIQKDEAPLISVGAIAAFLDTPLYQRMSQAGSRGQLHRESPFVLGVAARELKPETDSDEIILVQGIVDAWFREEDGLVVVDYKTDRVAEPDELLLRYRTQLELYERALERLTGLKVKEKLLYSFRLNKVIGLQAP